jgi:hypothetical protein
VRCAGTGAGRPEGGIRGALLQEHLGFFRAFGRKTQHAALLGLTSRPGKSSKWARKPVLCSSLPMCAGGSLTSAALRVACLGSPGNRG